MAPFGWAWLPDWTANTTPTTVATAIATYVAIVFGNYPKILGRIARE